ncbi:hypothetical protein ADK86_12920 [Streptomyces sp. NRRL F-5755]|uniref:hypothetical protein n=1 Tax=Streptomyces sp. NRRL F-5755 TaxID=1519475 RepID=UPI0006AFC062|nr:hypothetical protein [Streptomyces sp. NRRL F-5755]KOU01066.1 hypothetical protein ADK86_12920 [Streptomyces sp. NRRL F-5755]
MDPIVLAAGSALVSAMATDGWQQARDAVATWWRRARPERADSVGADLDMLRAQIVAARADADGDAERALAGVWHLRLQQILEDEPTLAAELQQLLDDHLAPALPPDERVQVRSVVMKADARDSSRVYMAGRDQHITGS